MTLVIFIGIFFADTAIANQDILINFHARIQLDAHYFNYPNELSSENDYSFSELRRAQLENIGVFYNTVKYKISGDFAHDDAVLQDAYVSIQGDTLRLVMGQFYYPFGNETQGLSKDSEFMEKSSIASLVSYGRDRGLSIQTFHSRYLFLQAGVVQGTGSNTSDNNSEYDKVLRLGLDTNPRSKSERRFLFGFSAAAGHQRARIGESIRIYPESHSELVLFKASIPENSDYLRSRFAVESIFLNGPFMFKPEFYYVHYGFDESVHIMGYYLSASYFLSGEQRSINNGLLTRQRIFDPISRGGWGAWELALRYSTYVTDSAFYRDDTLFLGWPALSRDVYPQKTQAVTFGINWYPHGLIRLMLNNVSTFIQHANDSSFQLKENAWLFRVQAEY